MGLRIAAIVLAAGAGSRFGGGKVRATIGGTPMLGHVLDRLADAAIEDVVVVLGDDADAVETALPWRHERRVRNPDPGRGLASSLHVGLAEIPAEADAALILLGDQPFVSGETIRALISTADRTDASIIVPAHQKDGGRNPVLLRRSAFGLANEATGDRGLGPLLARHADLVVEVPVGGQNPDIDTRGDLVQALETSWGARVRANADQVDRLREVPDGADFYAPVRSLFRADPTRNDDPVLDALLELIEPGDTWLDVGAGAGRFALPIARALRPYGGRVIAIDASPSMLQGLREIAAEHEIRNVETIEGRWPMEAGNARSGDVALIAHVGYDIVGIGAFVDALEAAASRLCVAVLMDRAPASASDPFWPIVHGEARVPLPGLPELVELLRARGREPQVSRVIQEPRTFETREALGGFARRQLWIDPAGAKERRFQAALAELTVEDQRGGWSLRDRPMNDIGIATWHPRSP